MIAKIENILFCLQHFHLFLFCGLIYYIIMNFLKKRFLYRFQNWWIYNFAFIRFICIFLCETKRTKPANEKPHISIMEIMAVRLLLRCAMLYNTNKLDCFYLDGCRPVLPHLVAAIAQPTSRCAFWAIITVALLSVTAAGRIVVASVMWSFGSIRFVSACGVVLAGYHEEDVLIRLGYEFMAIFNGILGG